MLRPIGVRNTRLIYYPAVWLLCIHLISADIPIRIINIVIGDNDLYGYGVTSSAYDVAFERGRRMYPDLFDNINRVTFYQPGEYTCQDAGATMVFLMTALYSNISVQDRNDFVIVFAPGCTAEIMNLGDFTREMNAPVLASTVMDNMFANKERFPTVIAAGPSGKHLVVQTVLSLLTKYNWTSISLICDLKSDDATENLGSLEICREAQDYLHVRPWLYNINSRTFNIDSSNKTSFADEILLARSHSKVIVLVSIPEVQKILLAEMSDLNMTDGNYVFITFRIPQLSYYYEALWQETDDLTVRALDALQFCFVLSTNAPDWSAIGHDRRRMIYKSWTAYQHIVPKEYQYNELQISAYETFLMALQVLNESYTGHIDDVKGAKFSRLFWNRQFVLPSRTVYISKSGVRIENVIISQFNNGTFQKVLLFDAQLQMLTNRSNEIGVRWIDSVTFPPRSDPFCDPTNPSNVCSEPHISSASGLYFVTLVLVVFIGSAVLCLVYGTKSTSRSQGQWWHVRNTYELTSATGGDYKVFPGIAPGHDISALQQASMYGRAASEDARVDFSIRMYKSHAVHVISVLCSLSYMSIIRRPRALAVLKRMQSLEHSNIASFYGLSFTPFQTLFITEATQRGFLRDLIDSQHVVFSWDLRFSFIWDLLNGIRYIHQSPLLSHGLLSSMSCLVDQYFTLKIAQCGMRELYAALADDGSSDFQDPTPSISVLWMAPEVISATDTIVSRPADVYGFGVILYELVTRNYPFNVEPSNPTAVKLLAESIGKGTFTYTALYSPAEVLPALGNMMRHCWSREPVYRPSVQDMATVIKNSTPDHFDNFVDNLMARLEKYNLELESLIEERTDGLVEETKKVDRILESILPRTIARRLRDKQIIVPEHFESASIMFSDIPAFDSLASQHSPLALVELLHSLYSTMDDVILKFEVYKVETIKDSYMVSSGIPERNGIKHAAEIARLALLLQDRVSCQPFHLDITLKLRIGINSGPCVAAVIGRRLPHYVLVGDTINMASRMQTSGEEMKIHISSETENLLNLTGKFVMRERELITIKGKGMHQTYWLTAYLGD